MLRPEQSYLLLSYFLQSMFLFTAKPVGGTRLTCSSEEINIRGLLFYFRNALPSAKRPFSRTPAPVWAGVGGSGGRVPPSRKSMVALARPRHRATFCAHSQGGRHGPLKKGRPPRACTPAGAPLLKAGMTRAPPPPPPACALLEAPPRAV